MKSEVRLTLRIPRKLYNQIIQEIDSSNVHKSFNSFVLECSENYLKAHKEITHGLE